MKFELIRAPQKLDMYGSIPCLPVEYSCKDGERFTGKEADSWLLLEKFVPELDKVCPNDLDYGDVDYFEGPQCLVLKKLIKEEKEKNLNLRLRELYEILDRFIDEAIYLGTGVVIEL